MVKPDKEYYCVCISNKPRKWKCPVLTRKQPCIENCAKCYENDVKLYDSIKEL